MSVLVIGPAEQEKIRDALAEAKAAPIKWEVLKKYALPDSGDRKFMKEVRLEDRARVVDVGGPRSYPVMFPGGVIAAISFEEQPCGLVKHLSISTPRGVPHPVVIAIIADAFEMPAEAPTRFWLEEFEKGRHAINLVQLVE